MVLSLSGIGFSRQMILCVYGALKAAMLALHSGPVPFLHFFQLDDDLDKLTVFDKTTFSRVPCSLSVALQFLQQTMQSEIKLLDRRAPLIADVKLLHNKVLAKVIVDAETAEKAAKTSVDEMVRSIGRLSHPLYQRQRLQNAKATDRYKEAMKFDGLINAFIQVSPQPQRSIC